MTDDSSAERTALANTWPTAHLLLCTFHVLGKEWKWLLSNCNQKNRQTLMGLFYKVIKEINTQITFNIKYFQTQISTLLNFYNQINNYQL